MRSLLLRLKLTPVTESIMRSLLEVPVLILLLALASIKLFDALLLLPDMSLRSSLLEELRDLLLCTSLLDEVRLSVPPPAPEEFRLVNVPPPPPPPLLPRLVNAPAPAPAAPPLLPRRKRRVEGGPSCCCCCCSSSGNVEAELLRDEM